MSYIFSVPVHSYVPAAYYRAVHVPVPKPQTLGRHKITDYQGVYSNQDSST